MSRKRRKEPACGRPSPEAAARIQKLLSASEEAVLAQVMVVLTKPGSDSEAMAENLKRLRRARELLAPCPGLEEVKAAIAAAYSKIAKQYLDL